LARGIDQANLLQFAATTWDERSHPAYPTGIEVDLDTNLDGSPDWYVYTAENGGFAANWQTLVHVERAGSPFASAYHYLDADLNSTNRVLTVPMAAVGLAPGAQFDFSVVAYDNYFSGLVTDEVGPMRYTAGTPRYVLGGDLGSGTVAPGGSSTAAVTRVDGGAQASPDQSGILLLHRLDVQGGESSTVRVEE
jgi:minor extracellular serine protease Vpr